MMEIPGAELFMRRICKTSDVKCILWRKKRRKIIFYVEGENGPCCLSVFFFSFIQL